MDKKITLEDNFLWLEDTEGDRALNGVKEQNSLTDKKNEQSKRYKFLNQQALELLEDKNKIPHISMRGNYVYNLWQDSDHIKGIWRRTSLTSYQSKYPNWETLLDIDLLSEKEDENWVFKNSDFLEPNNELCLIHLSRGGKDATVIREFNLKNKKFVENGFNLPEAKSWVSWRDQNSLYVGTDFGKGSLTNSGYSKITKIWRRNTPLSSAKTIFTGNATDMGSFAYVYSGCENSLHTVSQLLDFYEKKYMAISGNELSLIPVPTSADINAFFKKHLIISLNKDWTIDKNIYSKGSVLAITNKIIGQGETKNKDIIVLMSPTSSITIEGVARTKDKLIISTLNNIRGKLFEITYNNNLFSEPKPLDISSKGDIKLSTTNISNNLITYFDEGFLTPRSLHLFDLELNKSYLLKNLPPQFDTKNMIVEQRWSTSKDGTKIPYFIVGKKDVLEKGNAPTLLYGYGGFNSVDKPYYSKLLGKLWLEKGGVYVLANIRGGGEFGPAWHQSAILKNKHKSYEDFISIAEHLILTNVTTNKKLAIQGGSNGGLLVGAVMIKRPDLFNSVICQVPLLDMLRYSKLLAGASWMAEYGDPDDPEMKDYILTYSPYQNVRKNIKYPNILILTSTKDDRVHPGHARKMAARMIEQGHSNINYYENMEGGHSASVNLKQTAKMQAIGYEFLFKNLTES